MTPPPAALLEGQRYARLEVVREVKPRPVAGKRRRCVLVRCVCGATLEVLLHSLKSGNTKSCGCLQREAAAATGQATRTHPPLRAGERFGRLVVLRDEQTRDAVAVLCDCGTRTTVTAPHLRDGHTISCGCARRERAARLARRT
jgi:hypothetical protein